MISPATLKWAEFKLEAIEISTREKLLFPFINMAITSHESFEDSIATLLSINFAGVIPFQSWKEIFLCAFEGDLGQYNDEFCIDMMIMDLQAIKNRDPACQSLVNAYLNFKGFKALQSHRAAHILWKANRKEISLAIQSRCAELWSVDIHPAADIGGGLMIDHGTGVVIGETAVVGRNCSFLHGVTLGSTGKDCSDRHPKIGDDVLIGCNAMILGNIHIGRSCKIGSGSVVIKSLPNNVTAVGNPARIIGQSSEKTSAAAEMDLALKNVVTPCGSAFRSTWAIWADGSIVYEDIDIDEKGFIDRTDIKRVLVQKHTIEIPDRCIDMLFSKLDHEGSGRISRPHFEEMMTVFRPLLNDDKELVKWKNFSLVTSESSADAILMNYFRKISETVSDGLSI